MLTINSYLDQVLSKDWIEWCESALNPAEKKYRYYPGFQDAIGAQGSSDRTRSGELYAIGLLKGPLVRPQSYTGGAALGWKLVQSGAGAQSRLGYMGYAVGKILRNSDCPQTIKRAFSVLCTLFALQMSTIYQDRVILTVSLFQYLLKNFRPGVTLPANWNRYLATAMFCTLYDDSEHNALLDMYLNNQSIDKLFIVYTDKRKREVSPDELEKMASSDEPVTNVSPPKAALFWIGTGSDAESRGMYTQATKEGAALLQFAEQLERDSIVQGLPNPFAEIVEKNAGSEQNIIEQLDLIFRANAEILDDWGRSMKTLSDGVVDALAYLSGKTARGSIQKFFAHGVTELINPSQEIELDVAASECVSIPNPDDQVFVNDILFHVLGAKLTDGRVSIKVTRA
jgi:hypothetical protein